MTSIIRKTIATAIAAAALAVTFQPVTASAGGKFVKNPGIVKPWKPGGFKPNPPKPHKPHHHGHGNAAGAAALGIVGGMIIGSAIANQQQAQQPIYAGNGNAHVAWCLDRYRSYDVPTDTYMSHSGYRKYCNSPYN
jgi:BA14K-like protein